ncbi:hypothetical protein [Streptomyces smyrnaeus]|uniref:hypothetical protein n=1 Tax=Streptomyces smyrnaeus TaxID=1387713 RepID=UPI0036AD9912
MSDQQHQQSRIRLVTCNFERNGGGDRERWERMHALLASLDADLLLRQEMKGCEDPATGLWQASKDALGMDGVLAPHLGATAVYWRPDVFELSPADTDATWAGIQHWPAWWLHPAAVTLRLCDAPRAVDVVAASLHLAFDSVSLREAEVEMATRFGDRRLAGWASPLPSFVGGDFNSFPARRGCVRGEVRLPRPRSITDLRHLVHRSRPTFLGWRRMDSYPDKTLTKAGFADAARHFGRSAKGHARRLAIEPTAPTLPYARADQGPARRIDRIYLIKALAPAITRAVVIDPQSLSDHRIVLVDLDRAAFISLYDRYILAA